jgi:hypothetical protein
VSIATVRKPNAIDVPYVLFSLHHSGSIWVGPQ